MKGPWWNNLVAERHSPLPPQLAEQIAAYNSTATPSVHILHSVVPNHNACAEAIRADCVDLIVLANTRIIKAEVLEAAASGALNCHPDFVSFALCSCRSRAAKKAGVLVARDGSHRHLSPALALLRSSSFILNNTRVLQLPGYRGAVVFIRLINDDRPLGVTCHWALPKVDVGPIACTQALPVYAPAPLACARTVTGLWFCLTILDAGTVETACLTSCTAS